MSQSRTFQIFKNEYIAQDVTSFENRKFIDMLTDLIIKSSVERYSPFSAINMDDNRCEF